MNLPLTAPDWAAAPDKLAAKRTHGPRSASNTQDYAALQAKIEALRREIAGRSQEEVSGRCGPTAFQATCTDLLLPFDP